METRPLHFENFDQLLAEVERLRGGGYTKRGLWDLPQILDHLARAMTTAFDKSGPRVPRPFRWIARRLVHRMAVKQKYPKFKMISPRAMRPAPDITDAIAFPAFESAVQFTRNLKGETIETNGFGTLPLYDYQQMQLLHAAHHLSFLIPV